MKRYGPLIAVPGALALGDPGRHHLRLMPEALVVRDGSDSVSIHAWDDVERVRLDVPTTRFRLPGLVSTVVIGAVTALTMDSVDLDPDDGTVELVVAGARQSRPLSRHHVGGYWAPTVAGAERLIAHLLSSPSPRKLLAHPQSLIDLAARLARAQGANDG